MSCKFRADWLQKKEYRDWVRAVPKDSTKAFCHACRKTVDLSNMGQQALNSHMKGKKHEELLAFQLKTAQQPITAFCKKDQSASLKDSEQSASSEQHEQQDASTSKVKNTIASFTTSKDAKKAEIIWLLKSIMSKYSYNSSNDIGDVFRRMFPDSDIARSFKCGPTKQAYLINFGIGPYFTESLLNKVREAVCYVISFDESFNCITQQGQMDIIVRYFYGDKVVSQYLDSQFIEHASAKDLLSAFKKGTSTLNPSKLLQVSMDGPNVNFKFLSELVDDRKKEDPDLPSILQLGSCTLHIVHGAFATAVQKTGWKLESLLRAIWYLFADSPARRADFKEITKTEIFGLQFCSTRWVEDVCVAERAIKIWPNLVTYVIETCKKPKSKIPTVASFTTLRDSVINDPLVVAKLEVFISTAKLVQPFLKKYQTDKPMIPFITEDLAEILQCLMARFIKESVLTDAKTPQKLASVDVMDEANWLPTDKVDPGFVAKRLVHQALQSKAASPLVKKEFQVACRKIYSEMTKKMLERCPLKYSTVRALQALDPRFMVAHVNSAEEKFKTVLNKLVDIKWQQDRECDKILHQFREVLSLLKRQFKVECENFSVDRDRVDTFFHSVIGLPQKPEVKELWDLMKLLLTLSHGQAAVERGFSVNKDLLAPNLKTQSLVSQRVIHDTIALSGLPVADFEISPGLLKSCSHGHARYTAFLEEEKKEKEKQRQHHKRAAEETELCNAQKKLKTLELTLESVNKDADKHALKAEHKSDFTLLSKSNALRQKAKEIEGNIKTQKGVVEELSASLQKV